MRIVRAGIVLALIVVLPYDTQPWSHAVTTLSAGGFGFVATLFIMLGNLRSGTIARWRHVWGAALVSMLLLDLAIYLQHVMFHAVPALWRLHRMHHADLDFDATTGLRFHPVEIAISMAIKLAVVAALGPPAFAVLPRAKELSMLESSSTWRLRVGCGRCEIEEAAVEP